MSTSTTGDDHSLLDLTSSLSLVVGDDTAAGTSSLLPAAAACHGQDDADDAGLALKDFLLQLEAQVQSTCSLQSVNRAKAVNLDRRQKKRRAEDAEKQREKEQLTSVLDELKKFELRHAEIESELSRLQADQLSSGDELSRERQKIELLQERQLLKQKKAKDMEKKIEQEDSRLDRERHSLEEYCRRCKTYLGLDVKYTTHETVILQFYGLDKSGKKDGVSDDDGDCCSCEVDFGTEAYKILRTQPALESSIVSNLEKHFNETKDMSGFVVTLRKKFLEHLQK